MNLFENLCLFNESDNSKAVKSKLIESNNSVYKDFSTTINNYESEINDGLRSGRLDRIDNTLEKLPIVINELENQLNLLNDEYRDVFYQCRLISFVKLDSSYRDIG